MKKTDIAKSNGSDAFKVYEIEGQPKSDERHHAELAFSPVVTNMFTSVQFAKSNGALGVIDINEARDVFSEKVGRVQAGDLSDVEATLTAQVATLDAIFNNLAKRAALNIGGHMGAVDTYLRLALKAQSQCRTTIEAIAEIKYPKSATFIKQANIAGQQQVNNGQVNNPSSQPAQEKNITPSNELLTESAHATLDARGTGTASSIDSELEAVGSRYRPKNGRRKGKQCS